jgi:hypothetical protein
VREDVREAGGEVGVVLLGLSVRCGEEGGEGGEKEEEEERVVERVERVVPLETR